MAIQKVKSGVRSESLMRHRAFVRDALKLDPDRPTAIHRMGQCDESTAEIVACTRPVEAALIRRAIAKRARKTAARLHSPTVEAPASTGETR